MRRFFAELLRIAIPLAILAAGTAICITLIWMKTPPEEKDEESKVAFVETTSVRPHRSGLVLSADGVVVPHREIQVAAEVSGIIEKKSPNCRAGKYVRQGEFLYRIEKDYYEKDLEILEKEFAQAERMIAELDIEKRNLVKLIANAEAQEKIERDQEERYRGIRKSSERLLTEREFDLQQLALLGIQNQLITLHNQQALLETNRRRRRWSEPRRRLNCGSTGHVWIWSGRKSPRRSTPWS